MLRKYVSVDNYASHIFNYDLRASKLSRHPSAKTEICPAGRVLTETGKQLLPGISPGIHVRMVSVYDETTMIRGFINPSDGAVFQTYDPALLEMVKQRLAATKVKAEYDAELERKKEEDNIIAMNTLKRQSDEQLEFEKREKDRLDEIKSEEIVNMRKRQIELGSEVEKKKVEQEAQQRRLATEEKRKKYEEAQLKVAEDARLKAEEEAQLKAVEDALLKLEEDTRLKLEEEARLKADKEARLKTEEEARLKAAEEARLKAAEEARIKAEEARLKSAEEARIKAEEATRIKAEKQSLLLQAEAEKKFPILSLNVNLPKETLNAYIEKHTKLVNKYTDILTGSNTDNVIKTKVKGSTATSTPYAFEDSVINIVHYSNFKIVSSTAVESKVVQFLITNYAGGLITVTFDKSEMIIENEYVIEIPGKSERTCIISCYSDGKKLIEYARSKPLSTPKNTKF
jgi:hypothetical protein